MYDLLENNRPLFCYLLKLNITPVSSVNIFWLRQLLLCNFRHICITSQKFQDASLKQEVALIHMRPSIIPITFSHKLLLSQGIIHLFPPLSAIIFRHHLITETAMSSALMQHLISWQLNWSVKCCQLCWPEIRWWSEKWYVWTTRMLLLESVSMFT